MKKILLSIACLFGSLFTNAQTGAALNFDGADDYVDIGTVIPLNSSYTKEAWLYANASGSNNIISSGSAAFWIMGGQLSTFNNGGSTIQDPATFPLNQWVHVAVTFNSTNSLSSLYKNGILVASGISNSGYTNDAIAIGQYGTSGANFFQGTMDEVRLWNVARTQCEIISYMNCEIPGSATGLLANYHFNQGIVTVNNSTVTALSDDSGNSNTGTLTNFALNGSTSNWIAPGGVTTGSTTPSTCTLAAALNFDGANDDVRATGFPNFTEYTIEGWFNLNSLVDQNLIVGTGNGNPNTWFTNQLQLTGGKFTHYLYDGVAQMVTSPITPVTGVWYHVAIVAKNGNPVSIYVNGMPSVSNSNVGSMSGANEYRMAGTANGILASFNGQMDEVRIWNIARIQCEINSYMNCEIPTTATGLLANYHFNQGIAASNNPTENNLTDASGNSNTGTLTGFALSGATSNWVAPGAIVSGYTATLVPLLVNSTVTNSVICNGNSTTLSGTGANTYSWTNSVGDATAFSPTITATYTVTGTNTLTGCSNTAVNTVTVNALPTIAVNSGTICLGQSFTMTPSGAATYTFSNGSAIATPTANATYSVSGTDANGCMSSIDAISSVTVNICAPAAALNFDGANDYVQLLDPNFGISDFTLETWMNPNAATGAYLISTRTSEFGAGGNWFALGYGSAGKIGLELADAGIGYHYFETPGTPVVLSAWNHVALVRSGLNFSIYVNGVLSASYTDTGIHNLNTGTNSIRLSGWPEVGTAFFNGKMDETRFWNVARTQCEIKTYKDCEIPSSTAGLVANYHYNQGFDAANNPTEINLMDASGNSNTGTLTGFALSGTASNWIAPAAVVSGYTTSLAPPLVNSTVTNSVICNGNSTTLSGTGADNYSWTNSVANATAFSPTITVTYTVTGTNTLTGCSNTAVNTVTVNPLPIISVNSGAICTGKSFTMAPSGAATYTYSNGSAIATPTANASYNVTGTDANGCVSNVGAISSVTVNALPTIAVNSGAICTGKSFTMTPSGAVTYTYSNGSAIVSPTATASYSVTGTSTKGCVSSNTAVSSVTVNSLPTVMAATNSTLLCVGNSATLTASGATSYTWNTAATATVIAVSPTTTVTYTVNGTAANGCSNSAIVTQSVSACTGIVSLSNDAAIKLYPNPNNGLFTIELTSLSKVTVTNALGQIVIAETFEAGNHNLDIINQSNGVYFVKVIENNKQQIIKVIKQ